jgi:hypothetical protein
MNRKFLAKHGRETLKAAIERIVRPVILPAAIRFSLMLEFPRFSTFARGDRERRQRIWNRAQT